MMEVNFNDKSLNSIFKNLSHEQEKRLEKLNAICSDIKQMEKLLLHFACPSKGMQFTHGQEKFLLSWDGQRINILQKDCSSKRLIESKADIRLMASEYLKDFFEFCLKENKC